MSLWVDTLVKEKRELKSALDDVLNYLGTIYDCESNACEGCKEDIYQAVSRAKEAADNYRKDSIRSDYH